MKINEVKDLLKRSKEITFQLPDGSLVPAHFHVTEVGKVTRDFIDCGGTRRHEEKVNFQLWEESDYDHRLHPDKLLRIIELSQKTLGFGNLDVVVEYQGDTIRKFGLGHNGNSFQLTTTQTACLAQDNCGIPQVKKKVSLADLNNGSCCDPQSGCC